MGERIEQLISAEFRGSYRVYYDHKVGNPDRIVTQLGKGYDADNLAHVDIAIVSTRSDGESLCVISEIEEHKHTPKRLLGDIAAILMADNVNIEGRDYPLANLVVILGFVTRKNGRTGPRAKRYVSRFETAMGEGDDGRRGIRCIVLNAESGPRLVEEVEDCIKTVLIGLQGC